MGPVIKYSIADRVNMLLDAIGTVSLSFEYNVSYRSSMSER